MINVSNTYTLPYNRERYKPDPAKSLSCLICGNDTEFENGLCFDCICDIQDGSSDRIIESVNNHEGNPKEHDIEQILTKVSIYTGIPVDEIKTKKNKRRELTEARQIAQYIAKNNNCGSLAYIGYEIGRKNHATVIHSCKTIPILLDDFAFREKYIDLIKYYE